MTYVVPTTTDVRIPLTDPEPAGLLKEVYALDKKELKESNRYVREFEAEWGELPFNQASRLLKDPSVSLRSPDWVCYPKQTYVLDEDCFNEYVNFVLTQLNAKEYLFNHANHVWTKGSSGKMAHLLKVHRYMYGWTSDE